MANDIDLNRRRDPMHIKEPLTNAARLVNESNVGMMRSKIVQ